MAGYVLDCEHCGRRFSARRYSAKFCSTRCRTASHREPQLIARSLKKINNEIINIARQAKPGMSIQDMEALQNMEHEISWLLAREKNRRDDKRTIQDVISEEAQKNTHEGVPF